MAFEEYDKAKQRLESVIVPAHDYMKSGGKQTQQFFLDRAARFFDRLGNPEHGFQTIHVTGTSGKGSTTTMVYEALRADGRNVALYSSPYVTTAIENIEANGLCISTSDFARIANATLDVVDIIAQETPEWVPSYGEIFFAIGIQYFKEIGAEWLVLEVACGGRFDLTNIVPAPVVVGITPIGLDHTDILGDTVEKIAWQKAGIIKKGVQAVYTNNTDVAVRAVLEKQAAECETPIHYIAPQNTPGATPFETSMIGMHQQHNAALASALAAHVGVSEQAIAQGIKAARLPARTEVMQQHPLVMIDGAHSEPKIAALLHALPELKEQYSYNNIITVFSAKESKDLHTVLKPTVDVSSTIIMTEFHLPGFSSYSSSELEALAHAHDPQKDIRTEADATRAVEQALALAAPTDLVLITGSLYLAGIVRERWISTESILASRTPFPPKNPSL